MCVLKPITWLFPFKYVHVYPFRENVYVTNNIIAVTNNSLFKDVDFLICLLCLFIAELFKSSLNTLCCLTDFPPVFYFGSIKLTSENTRSVSCAVSRRPEVSAHFFMVIFSLFLYPPVFSVHWTILRFLKIILPMVLENAKVCKFNFSRMIYFISVYLKSMWVPPL